MAKSDRANSLADEILGIAATITRGQGTTFDRLPPDIQQTFLAIRETVRNGTNTQTKTALGKAFSQVLAARGLETTKGAQWAKWLEARD